LTDIASSNEAPSLPIADLYRQFLRREPTSAESLALETSAKAQANPENFIKKSLITSTEYANRLTPDFTTASGTLTFAKGDTSKTIEVKVTGDAAAEPDETFKVQLSNPVGATLGKETGTATIRNDDQ
jgi:hypothetical protein